MPLIPLVIMKFARCCFYVQVFVMSDFQPNEYLYRTHKKSNDYEKENENSETFAWSVRKAMLRSGRFDLKLIQAQENIMY
jgi:hypothetical protein